MLRDIELHPLLFQRIIHDPEGLGSRHIHASHGGRIHYDRLCVILYRIHDILLEYGYICKEQITAESVNNYILYRVCMLEPLERKEFLMSRYQSKEASRRVRSLPYDCGK